MSALFVGFWWFFGTSKPRCSIGVSCSKPALRHLSGCVFFGISGGKTLVKMAARKMNMQKIDHFGPKANKHVVGFCGETFVFGRGGRNKTLSDTLETEDSR